MRENLERVLQFMAGKKIRMHAITSKEVLEGNLKAVMRLILALAAHYKPQSVKHHDVSYEQLPETKPTPAAGQEARTTGQEVLTGRQEVVAGRQEVRTAGQEVRTGGQEIRSGGQEVSTLGKNPLLIQNSLYLV